MFGLTAICFGSWVGIIWYLFHNRFIGFSLRLTTACWVGEFSSWQWDFIYRSFADDAFQSGASQTETDAKLCFRSTGVVIFIGLLADICVSCRNHFGNAVLNIVAVQFNASQHVNSRPPWTAKYIHHWALKLIPLWFLLGFSCWLGQLHIQTGADT